MLIIEVIRVRVAGADVARLLEIRGAAMAEFRDRLPELRQADLVRIDDDVWLEIRTWGKAVEAARIEAAGHGLAAYGEMLALMTERLAQDRGERVHTTGTAWAAGR